MKRDIYKACYSQCYVTYITRRKYDADFYAFLHPLLRGTCGGDNCVHVTTIFRVNIHMSHMYNPIYRTLKLLPPWVASDESGVKEFISLLIQATIGIKCVFQL